MSMARDNDIVDLKRAIKVELSPDFERISVANIVVRDGEDLVLAPHLLIGVFHDVGLGTYENPFRVDPPGWDSF